jgi:hypothetical protein
MSRWPDDVVIDRDNAASVFRPAGNRDEYLAAVVSDGEV